MNAKSLKRLVERIKFHHVAICTGAYVGSKYYFHGGHSSSYNKWLSRNEWKLGKYNASVVCGAEKNIDDTPDKLTNVSKNDLQKLLQTLLLQIPMFVSEPYPYSLFDDSVVFLNSLNHENPAKTKGKTMYGIKVEKTKMILNGLLTDISIEVMNSQILEKRGGVRFNVRVVATPRLAKLLTSDVKALISWIGIRALNQSIESCTQPLVFQFNTTYILGSNGLISEHIIDRYVICYDPMNKIHRPKSIGFQHA